jgi:hypothetical protein
MMEQLTPNFSIEIPGGIHNVSGHTIFDSPLNRHAGGRQRNQLRRDDLYPKGNEPKSWSKRSKRKLRDAARKLNV